MLPTTGFFKNIVCPFYEKYCDRPYCHFKHRKKASETSEGATTTTMPPEVPTYNPTPKSQLANVRSHIPISYVPDLALRTERNKNPFRSASTYVYGGDKPTYNPTPLSMLSTGNVNTVLSNEKNDSGMQVVSIADLKYTPTIIEDDYDDDINFEDLETEFDLIDELITDSAVDSIVNGESEVPTGEEVEEKALKDKHKSKSKHTSKSSSKIKENGESSKSDSRSKSHSSSSSSKEKNKSESRHKDSKSSKSGSSDDRKKRSKSDDKKKSSSRSSRRNSKDKKHESKSASKHKEPKSSDKTTKKESTSSNSNKTSKTIEKVKTKPTKQSKNEDKTKTIAVKEEKNNYESYESNYMNDDDSDLEEDTFESCYKIFNEYKPTDPEIIREPKMDPQQDLFNEEETVLLSKKRIAHESATKTQTKVMFTKPKTVTSAAQTMMHRLKLARAAQANNEQLNIINEIHRQNILKRPSSIAPIENKKIKKTQVVVSKPSTSNLIDDIITGKCPHAKPRRIAPVPNVNSFQRAKAKLEEMAKQRAINTLTLSQTISKGAKRMAHMPDYTITEIPDVLECERSKLPVNVRTRYIKMIIDECAKLYLIKDEAQQRALNEEYKCYERCAALVTYKNSCMLAINRLRKELQERELSGQGPILPGELPTAGKNEVDHLKGRKFYENIKQYILSEDDLVLHGFPREGDVPGRAIIKTQKQLSKGYLGENDRLCCRCSKLYKVDDGGFALFEEECIYHPLKKRTFRGESIYLCCKSREGTGCVTSPTHVSENADYSDGDNEGFQTTLMPEYEDDPRSYEVFALDCEMCYTTKGLELTRVTIVNSECKTVYESLVKPLNSIIDYNTRFSGITEEQMNRTATSILQVQANILHLCNANTILIGHSLESDMKALKIIHNTIIDTSVLFPHKFGLPHKRALRDLAREYLQKIIQNNVSGHDSAEDALTCMELVLWKLKEEFKGRGIKI